MNEKPPSSVPEPVLPTVVRSNTGLPMFSTLSPMLLNHACQASVWSASPGVESVGER